MSDHAGNRHECVLRNYDLTLEQDYAFLALEASLEKMLDEIKQVAHDEPDDDRPGMVHNLNHLRKRRHWEACQASIKMFFAPRRDPHVWECRTGWAHKLLADNMSNLRVEKQDFTTCIVLRCAGGASLCDITLVRSKVANHTVAALCEFLCSLHENILQR